MHHISSFSEKIEAFQVLIDLLGSAKALLRIKVKVALLPDLLISKQPSLAG